jgi:hypothetical protein
VIRGPDARCGSGCGRNRGRSRSRSRDRDRDSDRYVNNRYSNSSYSHARTHSQHQRESSHVVPSQSRSEPKGRSRKEQDYCRRDQDMTSDQARQQNLQLKSTDQRYSISSAPVCGQEQVGAEVVREKEKEEGTEGPPPVLPSCMTGSAPQMSGDNFRRQLAG